MCYNAPVKVQIAIIATACIGGIALGVLGLEQNPDQRMAHEAHWDESQIPVSLKCAGCHRKEFDEWAGSHHAWAWRTTQATDAEAFNGQTLTAHGMELKMEKDAQGNLTMRDTKTGKVYMVDSVVGCTPLMQFLVRGEDGGLQTPSAAWDVKKKEWFDVFRDDALQQKTGGSERKAGEWGHWQGRGMNWNSQCAWCHMSGFRKQYDINTESYRSQWQEPGVTCIQCHKVSDKPDPADGCLVLQADRKLTDKQNNDTCAACHARREELTDQFTAGDLFEDHYRLELPRIPGVFYPNGLQLEEDYTETSFRLSRMGMRGVACSECHNPHTGKLTQPAENDQLCLQCHATNRVVNGALAPQVKRNALCGGHANSCVECHMPEMTYMGRDKRRDHTLHWPDPRMSMELGVPNPCLSCHQDKDHEWAATYLEKRYGEKIAKYRERFRAVGAAMKGQGNQAQLLAAYAKEENPAWRATMLGLLADMPRTSEILTTAQAAMSDASPMVRAAATAIITPQDNEKLLQDPVRSVRHAAAWQLFPQIIRTPGAAPVLKEMQETATLQGDQPTGAVQLAMLTAATGNAIEAESQYKRAIQLDPTSIVPRMDLAVFLARQNRLHEALQQMLACTAAHPNHAEAQYRLGILLIEMGHLVPGRKAIEKALRLDPNHASAKQTLQQLRYHMQFPR